MQTPTQYLEKGHGFSSYYPNICNLLHNNKTTFIIKDFQWKVVLLPIFNSQ